MLLDIALFLPSHGTVKCYLRLLDDLLHRGKSALVPSNHHTFALLVVLPEDVFSLLLETPERITVQK